MQRTSTNEGKFPPTRRFDDEIAQTNILSVRCAECAELPYRIAEGQPFRSSLIGRDDTTVVTGCNSIYNYWPAGIGHLLEVFPPSLSDETLSFARSSQIEIGFLVYDEENLIVVAYRFGSNAWNVTPYLWHAYKESTRDTPPETINSADQRKFTIALVDDVGGKYRFVKEAIISQEFAMALNTAIRKQIAQGIPEPAAYSARVDRLWELLHDDKVNSMLQATAVLQ
ncbi:MAG: hypothetical protein ACXWID_04095 [Pyrinomonadaceae bacterium]